MLKVYYFVHQNFHWLVSPLDVSSYLRLIEWKDGMKKKNFVLTGIRLIKAKWWPMYPSGHVTVEYLFLVINWLPLHPHPPTLPTPV